MSAPHRALVLGVRGVGVVRDLLRDGRLATRQQRHLVAILDQLPREVRADEACAACGSNWIA